MSEYHETPPAPPSREQEATTGPLAPERKEANAEKLIDRLASQPVARLMAIHEDEHAFDPDLTFGPEAKVIAADTMKQPPSSTEVAADSYEARKTETAGDVPLQEKTRLWRESMQKKVKEWNESPDATTIQDTLKSLGIEKETSDEQLETFREKYVPSKNKGESDISAKKRAQEGLEQFAKDMAEGCRTGENGQIDLEEFDKRLNASQELLAIFGTKDNADLKVKYYATAYAMADEKNPEDTKKAATEKIANHLQQAVTDPVERKILTDLHQRHQQIEEENQKPPEPEPEPEQTTEASESSDKDKFLTTSRLQELQSNINEFLAKDKNQITEEDLTRIKPILSEFLKGSQITDEEQFTDMIGKSFQEEGAKRIMDKITEAWHGETPSFYALQTLKDDDGKIVPSFSLNENLPTLLRHEALSPIINDLLEQAQAPAEKNPQGKLEALKVSRLHEIIDGLQNFAEKTKTGTVTEDDNEQAGSLFKEYLTGVEFFSEEEYKETLKQLPENQIQELISKAKEAYGGNVPDIGYAIRAVDNDGKPALDPISDNQIIPQFMANEKLAEIINKKLLEQMPPEEQPEA